MTLMALFWTIEIIVWGSLFYHWFFRIQGPEVMSWVAFLSIVGVMLAALMFAA